MDTSEPENNAALKYHVSSRKPGNAAMSLQQNLETMWLTVPKSSGNETNPPDRTVQRAPTTQSCSSSPQEWLSKSPCGSPSG